MSSDNPLDDLSRQIALARHPVEAPIATVNGSAAPAPGADAPSSPVADAPPAPATASAAPGTPSPAASGRHASPWPRRLRAVAGLVAEWLSRPPVRLALIGVALLVVAALFLGNSFWTLPVVIAGVLMVLIAWVGSRLNGHFVVEWGESGTQLQFRARIKSAGRRHGPAFTHTLALHDREPIEADAHTVEIDLGELKALVAAAEAGEQHPAPNGTAHHHPAP